MRVLADGDQIPQLGLGVEYVDLYLVHWPQGGATRAWHGMERAHELGYARWCVQRALVVIPKTTHRERIEENAQIFDFTLSNQDMAELDALDKTGGTGRAVENKWW